MDILLDKITNKFLIEHEPTNRRILRTRFQAIYFKLTVMQTYAPTEEYDEGTKELYYEQLQQISRKGTKT